MASFLVVNIFTGPHQQVKDFCVYRRHRCDLASERAGKSFGGEVDGLCLLVEGTLGKVSV